MLGPVDNYRQRGLTLIEILVVMFIIGIMLTIVTFSFGDSETDRMQRTADRLVARTKLAKQQALFNGQDLALSFWQNGYDFQRRQFTGWEMMRDDNIFKPQPLPKGLEVELYLDGTKAKLPAQPSNSPQVFILSDGQLTPFEAHISDGDHNQLILHGNTQGDLSTRMQHR